MAGLYMFTNDPASAGQTSLNGDLLCVLSAVFYSAYDIRFFDWGRELGDKPVEMIQYKVRGTQVSFQNLLLSIIDWSPKP